jgi:hypothetical protein
MHSYHHSIALNLFKFVLLFIWIKTPPQYVYVYKGKFTNFWNWFEPIWHLFAKPQWSIRMRDKCHMVLGGGVALRGYEPRCLSCQPAGRANVT